MSEELPQVDDFRRLVVEDVPLLLEHFLKQFSEEAQAPVPKLSGSALDRLLGYDWPGNVREIQNEARRLVALHLEEAGEEHLSERVRRSTTHPLRP